MNADLSIITLVLNASLVVQLVMALLLIVSIVSWTFIVQKSRVLKQAIREADVFEDRFFSGGDLNTLYTKVSASGQSTGMANIFEAGFKEFVRLSKQKNIDADGILEGSQRAMRIALARETDHLELHLPFLATVGSTSPYVGLFGTVWGIMNSFRALGNVKQATLGMVAPGIAEALIATAMGLFAAIPAVIGYNRFVADLDRLMSRYQSFIDEFSSILHRHAHK